jgi:hypothetical protein
LQSQAPYRLAEITSRIIVSQQATSEISLFSLAACGEGSGEFDIGASAWRMNTSPAE